MGYCENCKKFNDQWENPIKDGELCNGCDEIALMARCGCETKSAGYYFSTKGSILIKLEKNFVEEDEDEEDDEEEDSDDDDDEEDSDDDDDDDDDGVVDFDPLVDFYTVKIFNKDGVFDRYWEDGIIYTNEDDALFEYQLACDSIQISSEIETCSVLLAFSHNTMACKRFIDGVDIDVMGEDERKQNQAIIDKLDDGFPKRK